jgi:predicted  nucleic acid-binding Zn-ribbon protein
MKETIISGLLHYRKSDSDQWTEYTAKELMQKILTMDGQATALTEKVDDLSRNIEKVQASFIEYATNAEKAIMTSKEIIAKLKEGHPAYREGL